MKCPECQSENVRKKQIIYEENTYEGDSTTKIESGFFSENKFSGSANSSYNSQSKLAELCAPPEEPYPSIFFHILAIIVMPFFGWPYILKFFPDVIFDFFNGFKGTSGLVVGFGFILLSYLVRYLLWSKLLWAVYKNDLENWQNKWLCLKCRHSFSSKKKS